MLNITDIQLSKTYIDDKYWQPKYQTVLTVRVARGSQLFSVTLTDEQTESIVAQIVQCASAGMTLAHEPPSAPPPEKEPAALGFDRGAVAGASDTLEVL